MYLMSQERQQLQSVELASQVVSSQSDTEESLNDLCMLSKTLMDYDGKLQSLRQSFGAVSPLCSEHAQMQMRADIAMIDAEMSSLRQSCEANVRTTEEKVNQFHIHQAEVAAGVQATQTTRRVCKTQ